MLVYKQIDWNSPNWCSKFFEKSPYLPGNAVNHCLSEWAPPDFQSILCSVKNGSYSHISLICVCSSSYCSSLLYLVTFDGIFYSLESAWSCLYFPLYFASVNCFWYNQAGPSFSSIYVNMKKLHHGSGKGRRWEKWGLENLPNL